MTGGVTPDAQGVSDDGTIVLGESDTTVDGLIHAVTWTNLGAPVELAYLNVSDVSAYAVAISADNSKIFGCSEDSSGNQHAVVWESGTPTELPAIAGGGYVLRLTACSADGTMAVGGSNVSGHEHACLWTYAAGSWSVTDLGVLPSGTKSAAYGMSRDGVTIVGNSLDSTGNVRAVYWTGVGWPIAELPYSGPAGPGRGDRANSAYGSIIAGFLDSRGIGGDLSAAIWNSGVLTSLPGTPGYASYCISSDGTLIGGENSDGSGNIHATVWLSASPNTATQLPDQTGYNSFALVNAINASCGVAVGQGDTGASPSTIGVALVWEGS